VTSPAKSSGATLRRYCRAYREAATSYDRAFMRGDVASIEDAFSRMQDIARAFDQGVEWASRHRVTRPSHGGGAR
jgi:hypothetical protein